MNRVIQGAFAIALLMGATFARSQERVEVIPKPGDVVAVSTGQVFYSEHTVVPVRSIKLSAPFHSSMAGAMGFPFRFEIATDTLVFSGKSKDGNWDYYLPEGGKFSASHGLLGSVIDPGDTVGLRVGPNGEKEWFVDNSIHNGMTTIWSRKYKSRDPSISFVETGTTISDKHPIDLLTYLGAADGKVRIRWEHSDPRFGSSAETFEFPVENGEAKVGIRGAAFVVQPGSFDAKITMLRPMESGVGHVVP
jgi:hypothetical protein